MLLLLLLNVGGGMAHASLMMIRALSTNVLTARYTAGHEGCVGKGRTAAAAAAAVAAAAVAVPGSSCSSEWYNVHGL
jgi:hypothetical protein